MFYLPRLNELRSSGRLTDTIENEIDLTWQLTQQIAILLEIDETMVEPLQLIHYQPGQYYKRHHDHGTYYGVDTEQRPQTLLLFLSTQPISDTAAGYTRFTQPSSKVSGSGSAAGGGSGSIAIRPVAGDAILWNNEDADGEILLQAIHEAVPPDDSSSGGSSSDSCSGNGKYAANVWISKDPIAKINAAAYRTT